MRAWIGTSGWSCRLWVGIWEGRIRKAATGVTEIYVYFNNDARASP